MARKKTTSDGTNTPPTKKGAKSDRAGETGKPHLYTLEVFIISGPVTRKFTRSNPVVSRKIQIRGDQTLHDLHQAIFHAFRREEEHMYEFQLDGTGPMDPKAKRYVLPGAFEITLSGPAPAGRVDRTTLDSLGLKMDDRFGYWFDFGDDWWHQVNVEAIESPVPSGKYPKVIHKVGKSPPQYADLSKEED
jgi:hypothetical protein